MKGDYGLIAFYLLAASVHHAETLHCYNCSRFEESCKDEFFQSYNQTSVDCGNGSCIKLTYGESGMVTRLCWSFMKPVCWSVLDQTICICDYKDNCNGPVGAIGAKEGGLQCYDCYLNKECSDRFFQDFPQILVNCGNGSCIKSTVTKTKAVHRHCSPTRVPTGCVDDTFNGQPTRSCACHNRDGCNSAATMRQTLIRYIILFIIGSITYYN